MIRSDPMPDKTTVQRAEEDRREGKSPGTQAGEFVREEIEHVREGKHGARSPKQAIAIGLSKARRAGVNLPPPSAAGTSTEIRRRAARDLNRGASGADRTSARRSHATSRALGRESHRTTSRKALSRQAKNSAAMCSRASRSGAARRAAATRKRARRRA
jgi:hypothetical protein